MSDCPRAPIPAAADNPPSEARAARLAKLEREKLIIDTLNRGVSVAEIAARIGIGEKRTRAVIRDPRTGIRGLARRMPHPPEEFVAIQMSRLNEALLVAYSVMSPANLKAVDQVVKIVRELDRYGGAFAAEWRRPEASRLDAPADEDAAFASAWLYDAEPVLPDFETAAPFDLARADRPENSAQRLEKVESAPGHDVPSPACGRRWPEGPDEGKRALTPALSREREKERAAPARDNRPENSARRLEKVESAPARLPLAPRERGEGRGGGGLGDWPPTLAKPLILAFSPRTGRRDAQPLRRATIAREIQRKTLKGLNPRPSSSPSPRFSGERVGVRGLGDWSPTLAKPLILAFSPRTGRRDAQPLRRATIARKIRRKTLKGLNPRPPSSPSPRASGVRVGVRGLGDWLPRLIARPLILAFSPRSPGQAREREGTLSHPGARRSPGKSAAGP